MFNEIEPPSAGDAELLAALNRIAAALERIGDLGLNIACTLQDTNRDICGTIAGLHDYVPKPPARGRSRP